MATIPSTRPRLRRLRQSLALAQTRIQTVEERARARWVAIPEGVRTAIDRARDRLRETLDLPSRGEIASLLERVEHLDRKLGALAETRLAALPAAGGDSALPGEDAEDAEIIETPAAESELTDGRGAARSARGERLDRSSTPRTGRSKKARSKKRGANGRAPSRKG